MRLLGNAAATLRVTDLPRGSTERPDGRPGGVPHASEKSGHVTTTNLAPRRGLRDRAESQRRLLPCTNFGAVVRAPDLPSGSPRANARPFG